MALRSLAALIVFTFLASAARAQSANDSLRALVHSLLQDKKWEEASGILKQQYDAAPGNPELYTDYFAALKGAKDWKGAEKLIGQQQRYSNNPTLLVDLGSIYEGAGKASRGAEQYENALKAVNGDESMAQQLVAAYLEAGLTDYAIKVYERMQGIMQNPFLYAGPLSRLYAKQGDMTKAVEALLNGGPSPFGGQDDTRSQLLELLGENAANIQVAQKAILRRINQQPGNTYYAELLIWLFTQKGDWNGALLQVQAIDERQNAGGQNLLQFARQAEKEKQFETARKSLDAVIEGGTASPFYSEARAEKLSLAMRQLRSNPTVNKDAVAALSRDFGALLAEYPQFTASETAREWAELEAQFNGNPRRGIEILQQAIEQPTASREFVGQAKLQLGDYLILEGKIWDASLSYSQVDKEFREDFLGEDARFRNGRLAYYQGDFSWAQAQLNVLKASTSELIANDALNLSVLITENTPDSNNAALLLYSRADLLLFQNRDSAALNMLDSINLQYPKHALTDDVLMLRASVAKKHQDYSKALNYLALVIKDFGKDVLADDAVFKTAVIYEENLKDLAKAKSFYEQLIIDYPGSTYVQIARNRLKAMETPDSGT